MQLKTGIVPARHAGTKALPVFKCFHYYRWIVKVWGFPSHGRGIAPPAGAPSST